MPSLISQASQKSSPNKKPNNSLSINSKTFAHDLTTFNKNALINRQRYGCSYNSNIDLNASTNCFNTFNILTAKLFASRGFRRRSYDDQEGDNDINIILQPSDLDDIEKQSRAKFAQLKALSSTNNDKPHIASTKTIEPKVTTSDHGARFSQSLNLINDRKTSRTTNQNTITTYYNNNETIVTTTRRFKASSNIFQDIKLAKCLLDQDYNQTVRLFIKKSALNWNFNSFTFDALCCGRSLTELLLHLFDYYNLYNIFNLDIIKVLKCFRLLEFGYHSTNPYHNSVHAADVTQAMHCFIQENKIRKHMTNLEILCSILAAVCHDLDHPGVNQSFLVATKNPLASLYQNNSVLENHHWRFALCIFRESSIFEHFEQETLDDMKDQLKHLILATDIARQNEYLKRFRDLTSSHEFSMSNTDDRALVLQMALKCADLGNPCRPWLISRVWSNLICDEFYRMGQIERRLGIPLTPICQREKTSIASIQTDFFRFIVLPLLELWHDFLDSSLSNLLMSNFDHNYKRWQRANRIVQQLRRRKSVACLEPVSDDGTDGKSTDFLARTEALVACESLVPPSPHLVRLTATLSADANGPDTQKIISGQSFFDPTMETLCSKHSFVAIKRASSDYIKSGNGRLELLRDFQLNRIIEKSPLMMRSCKFNSCDKPSAALTATKSTMKKKHTTRPGGDGCSSGSTSACKSANSAPQSSRCSNTKACRSVQSAAAESVAPGMSASSAAALLKDRSQNHEELPSAPCSAGNEQQQQYRKALSPIQDGGESANSPELGVSDVASPLEATRARHQPHEFLQPYQQDSDDQEDSASCSTPASRASSACSSPLMCRSASSRTSLVHHEQHKKFLRQNLKHIFEPPGGAQSKLQQTTNASKFPIKHSRSLYNNSNRRESDPGCPTDGYELAAALVLLQYQNNSLFHKRRSSLPVCVPGRRSSK